VIRSVLVNINCEHTGNDHLCDEGKDGKHNNEFIVDPKRLSESKVRKGHQREEELL